MIRKRHQNFERILGVAEFDLRNLRALKIKLDRDYLAFFKHLSGLYHRSAQKSELQVTVVKIKNVIGHLDSILEGRAISKKDAESLTLQINEINVEKDYFVDKIPEVQAFSDRVDKVSKETGISPEDLNITEDVVKGVTKGTRKAQKEGASGFARSKMPGTLGLAKQGIHGAAAALAGPFAGLLPIASELGGAAIGGIKKLKERRELNLADKLRSRGTNRTTGVVQDRSERVRDKVNRGEGSLAYFFNKTAYRTRWTRELLSIMKKLGGRGKGSIAGGLLAAGAIAAGAAAVAAVPILWTQKKYADWIKALTNQYEALERHVDVVLAFQKQYKDMVDKDKLSPEAKQTEKVNTFLTTEMERRKNLSQIAVKDVNTDAFNTQLSLPKNERNASLISKNKDKEEITSLTKENINEVKKTNSVLEQMLAAIKNAGGQPIPSPVDNGFFDPLDNSGGDNKLIQN